MKPPKYEWTAQPQECIDWKSGKTIITIEFRYRLIGTRRWTRFQIVDSTDIDSIRRRGAEFAAAHVKALAKRSAP